MSRKCDDGSVPKSLPVLTDTSPICCEPLTSSRMISSADALALAQRLKALGDPTRVQLVSLLMTQPGQEACTCELAPAVRLAEPTVSHHLKQLLDAGLVTKERRGLNVYYRLVPQSVKAIARVLNLDCC
jgi:ArsR family transcriptional regulator, arsenate/arsenite/antimonite-responsive transcriptional repressor